MHPNYITNSSHPFFEQHKKGRRVGWKDTMPGTISNDDLTRLYTWVDEIELSRPKRNIARDFSDGVLVAEVRDRLLRNRPRLQGSMRSHQLVLGTALGDFHSYRLGRDNIFNCPGGSVLIGLSLGHGGFRFSPLVKKIRA